MIHVDVHEPVDIQLLLQQSHQVERLPLNSMGFADYVWHTTTGTDQMEHKEAEELMSDLDHVEAQLGNQIRNAVAEHYHLGIVGMIAPVAGGTACYKMSKEGKVMYRTRTFRRPYTAVQGWLAGIEEAGVRIHWVPDHAAFAMLVARLHDRATKEDNFTFNRYIKERPQVAQFNPYVMTLMGVEGGGVGEVIGRSLIAKWTTPYFVFTTQVADLARTQLIGERSGNRVMGNAAANKLLRAIGRPDVLG